MSGTQKKLVATACFLLVSVVVLVSASMAWFTISTNPEITGMTVTLNTDLALLVSDSEDGFYDDSLYIKDVFDYLVGLRPVSTADGVNWFFPTYEVDGTWLDALCEIEDFFHWPETEQQVGGDETYGNVVGVETNDDGSVYYDESGNATWLTGKTLSNVEAEAGYAYFDVWLMTEEEEVDVRLSVPSRIQNNQADWEFDEGIYGSYVLANYQIETTTETVDGEESTTATALLEPAAQTAIRVGFMTFEYTDEVEATDDEGNPVTDGDGNLLTEETWAETGEIADFVIYEPNADQRSSEWDVKPNEGETEEDEPTYSDEISEYIKEYAVRADGANYQAGQYIPTQYIAWDADDAAPYLTTLDGDSLIIQKQSAWDDEALQDAITAQASALSDGDWLQDLFSLSSFLDAYNNDDFGYSNYVSTLGLFIADYDELVDDANEQTATDETALGVYRMDDTQNESTTGEAIIVTLYKDQPQRVRIYIWLEGQDVDCWNDISASSFVVNLELAAEVIETSDADA